MRRLSEMVGVLIAGFTFAACPSVSVAQADDGGPDIFIPAREQEEAWQQLPPPASEDGVLVDVEADGIELEPHPGVGGPAREDSQDPVVVATKPFSRHGHASGSIKRVIPTGNIGAYTVFDWSTKFWPGYARMEWNNNVVGALYVGILPRRASSICLSQTWWIDGIGPSSFSFPAGIEFQAGGNSVTWTQNDCARDTWQARAYLSPVSIKRMVIGPRSGVVPTATFRFGSVAYQV